MAAIMGSQDRLSLEGQGLAVGANQDAPCVQPACISADSAETSSL